MLVYMCAREYVNEGTFVVDSRLSGLHLVEGMYDGMCFN